METSLWNHDDTKRFWNSKKPVVFPKDDVVSLIHVLEVDAVSARDAAQQRLLEAWEPATEFGGLALAAPKGKKHAVSSPNNPCMVCLPTFTICYH